MDRDTYIQTLKSATFDLSGLTDEWETDDGECLDDEVNDELLNILFALEDLINKLGAKVTA